ncbi:MAG: CDP-alcohol phosphatidyltransferase family protein [Pseudomonadota bacterium]
MADRRPLASRDTRWADRAAKALVRTNITPNQISQASVAFAALAFAAFWAAGAVAGPGAALLLILGAVCVQLRLLCNLLDGMVAIEGGKSAPDGAFFNEAPDRGADILILVGAGLCLGAPALGFAAATGAVLTAYVRELGRAEGAPSDFAGPMAKPHRMAAITAGAVLGAIEALTTGTQWSLLIALWAVTLGAFATAIRRSRTTLRFLNSR